MFRQLHTESDELLHVDFLRFVASIGIVLLHFSRFASSTTQAVVGDTDPLRLFVDLFFCLSGFVIAYVYEGRITSLKAYQEFLQKRVARLLPLHWATLAFFLLVGVGIWTGYLHSDHRGEYNPTCILPNALALHAFGFCKSLSFNGASWSISAEMGMYLLAPVTVALAARSPWVLLVAAAMLIAGLSTITSGDPWYYWTSHFGVVRALPSFLIGAAIYGCRDIVVQIPAPRALAALLIFAFLVAERLGVPGGGLLILLYTAVACTVASDLSRRYKPLRIGALGQLTYSLYMIHPIVLTVWLSLVGQKILHLHGVAADMNVILAVLASIVISYLSLTKFETPARRKLSPRRRSIQQTV